MNKWSFIFAVLGLSAVQFMRAEPPKIKVNGGVYSFESEEVYLDPFLISQFAVQSDTPTCELPTMHEYLAAAKQSDFVESKSFEAIMNPPEDACTWSKEELEAEGVSGNNYFAGIGSHIPTDGFRFIRGGTDPKDSISSINTNIFAFWGEEFKPSTRAYRCVERNKMIHQSGFINGPNVHMYAGPRQDFKVKMKIEQNAPVVILFEQGGWAFIEAKGSHMCQEDPEWDVFEDKGWVRSASLRR